MPSPTLPMLSESFKSYLNTLLPAQLTAVSVLTGGDINRVYKLDTRAKTFVIKVNDAHAFPNMFELERLGLEHIAASKSFPVPQVLLTGSYEDQSFLILEYLKSAPKTENFAEIFGENLAQMHQKTAPFGFERDNYIGSLHQANAHEANALDFYINQRLVPQFRRARDTGYAFKNVDRFYKNLSDLIPNEPAALIHGDLWSGNYMVNEDGHPALIDPATCYAPREIDIALMHLFGGFDAQIFEVYNHRFPLVSGWRNRLKIWQLYYILVHVNLFGGSYYASAKAILQDYA